MKIEVLGCECAQGKNLLGEVEKAVHLSRSQATICKVEDVKAIVGYGVQHTPALVVDGKVRSQGRVPQALEIAHWIAASAGIS